MVKKYFKYKFLDTANNFFGKISSFLVLILIFLVSTSVILRYVFSIGFTWLQDLYIWIHAAFIMLGIAYTLKKNGHVRIDILYRNCSDLAKKKINFLGSIFFGLPVCYFLIFEGYEYFMRSFVIGEDSKESGGLQNLFILKFFIFFMGVLLLIEITNQILKFFSKND